MKSLSAAASVIALSLAFIGPASATQTPEPLSEAQLDQVVAGTSNQGNSYDKDQGNRGKSPGKDPKHGKGQDIAGIVGTGIVALRK